MTGKYVMAEYNESNYTLTVKNVDTADLGDYMCSAVNKIGEKSAIVTLTGK